MLRSLRSLALVGILVSSLAALQAQVSPFINFVDPSDFALVQCSSYQLMWPSYLYSPYSPIFSPECGLYGYQPLLSFYNYGYYRRHHGPQGYASVGGALMAYHHEGLRALDGMKIARGVTIGHGGKVQVPGSGFVRPVVDRSTGRLTVPPKAMQQAEANSAVRGQAAGRAGSVGMARGNTMAGSPSASHVSAGGGSHR